MRTKHERKKNQKQRQKRKKVWPQNYSERLRANKFCCGFQLNFFQLIGKVSVIYKSNLVLGLSIIFKKIWYASHNMLR